MIDVSIVLAARGRPDGLARLLASIVRNTVNLDRVEVLIGVDSDDENLNTLVAMALTFKIEIIFVVQPRKQNICNDYVNRLFRMSRGHWLWVMNDDAEIMTSGWDVALAADQRKKTPVCIDTLDNTRNFNNNGQFACFPMINRPAFDALGYFFHPDIYGWGADKWMCQVYSTADMIKVMHNIEVRHHRNCDDAQHENMKEIARAHGCGDNIDIDEDVRRLCSVS